MQDFITATSMNTTTSFPTTTMTQQQSRRPPRLESMDDNTTRDATGSILPRGVTKHQSIALSYVYSRLLFVWITGPAAVVVSQIIVFQFLLQILNVVTNGRVLLAVILATTSTLVGFSTIRSVAKTEASFTKAMKANEIRWPFISIILSCVASRRIIGPLLDMTNIPTISVPQQVLSWISLWGACRIAIVMSILQTAVIVRYVGPQSIMRCSMGPLMSNPIVSWCKYLVKYPASIVQPSDAPGAFPTTSLHSIIPQQRGRRFRFPGALSCLAQVCIAIMLGISLRYTRTLDGWLLVNEMTTHSASTSALFHPQSAILVACMCTMLSPLMALLNTPSTHEIDPKQYDSSNFPNGLEDLLHGIFTKSLWCALCASPFITLVCMFFSAETWEFMQLDDVVALIPWAGKLGSVVMVMVFYLCLFDEAIKISLFHPRGGIKSVENQILAAVSNQRDCLDVMLHSLLSEPKLVRGVLENESQDRSKLAVGGNAEQRELVRVEQLATTMGYALTTRGSNNLLEAPLEEDVLRHGILETLGGGCNPLSTYKSTFLTKAKPGTNIVSRHDRAIQGWLVGGSRIAPRDAPIVPLVRGLAVFIRGIGEALCLCFEGQTAEASTVPGLQRLRLPVSLEEWELPQGTISCAQFALSALTRCFVQKYSLDNADVRHPSSFDSLSLLLPATLQAIFQLRCGIQRCNENRSGMPKTGINGVPLHPTVDCTFVAPSTQALLQLLRTCDEAALAILASTMKKGDVYPSTLKAECVRWLEDCWDLLQTV